VLTLGKGFYFNLAFNNIKRNQKKFIPYFITATIMISVYFMVLLIIYTPGLEGVPENGILKMLFMIGLSVLSVFIAIFMLYINSFLIKQRKKEMGLYGILGLEKRHVGHLMLWENLIINGSALLLGMISGCVFGWLIFMLLMKSINFSLNSYFAIPLQAFIITFIFFAVLFFVISLINLFQVRIANPIDLLKSDHQGEKKTRFLIPITLFGAAALGYAYYIALTVKNPLQAINQFFFAVLLVILASYALFTSGSIFLLKLLKKNKKYYYRSENFISIGGMLHRMKQNASGLASICILSSMVLVTVSTCIALYLGQEDSLKSRSMDDIKIQVAEETTDQQFKQLDEMFQIAAEQNDVKIESEYRYFSCEGSLVFQNNRFIIPEPSFDYFEETYEDSVSVNYMTVSDFNRVSDRQEKLEDNQIILLTSAGEYEGIKEFTVGDGNSQITYEIADRYTDTVFTNGKHRKAKQEIFLVVKDREVVRQMIERLNPNDRGNLTWKIIMNISGSQLNGYHFGNDIYDNYGDIATPYGIDNIYSNRYANYSIYGGLLFMGAFFTILFLCATVLIIYFKQVSEGYDDKDRFEMLQKVGMDDREVKRTINKQILTVFFLPLAGALLHVAMASRMLMKMLEIFWLYNDRLTMLCIIGSCAVFTIVYVFVYRLTAKTYLRIVKW
jgi:putative ABC transport system permease protein